MLETMHIGLSYGYHDSSVSLVDKSEIIFASQEERYTRVKFDNSFPKFALKDIFKEFDVSGLKGVVYYEKPFKKLERQMLSLSQFQLRDWPRFPDSVASLRKLFLTSSNYINKQINIASENNFQNKIPVYYSSHHLSHAASAFYTSPFENSLILVTDAAGEFESTSLWIGKGMKLKKIFQQNFPNSYGIFYSAVTSLLGFKVNSGEFKTMGLAPYGRAGYFENLQNVFIQKNDFSVILEKRFINTFGSKQLYTKDLENFLKLKARRENKPLTQNHADLALATQEILEQYISKLVLHALEISGQKNLCVSGGVGLNCVMNTKLSRNVGHQNFYAFSASGDAGASLGAALAYVSQSIPYIKRWDHKNSLLGKNWENKEVIKLLNSYKINYDFLDDLTLSKKIADLISQGNIVGLFHGNEEFGPRSLGNRSIIADPREKLGQININKRIKFRESFRPFAPICIKDKVTDFFTDSIYDPFMLRVNYVKEFGIKNEIFNFSQIDDNAQISIKERIQSIESPISAVTHLDGSSRVQSIERNDPRLITKILIEFEKLTHIPILINTSFNVRGEPIVHTPFDALQCFATTDIDYLCLGNMLISKMRNPIVASYFSSQVKND
jgi:carbamoyltransferase